ncbi:MAG: hypothetical protein HC877_16480 [Thioploca sp.]|nr:hypothetical protein [Thioploca sp.]
MTGTTRVIGAPNATTTLTLTLANGSPVTDTFSLTVTDSGSWISGSLPPTVDLAELAMTDLTLPLTLPAEMGMTNTITVTATSKTDPLVTATMTIQVEVVDLAALITNPTFSPSEPGVVDLLPFTIEPVAVNTGCPTDGVIDFFCNNQGQILQDVTLTSGASITGGSLAGTLTNQGYVSQVTIQPGAVLTGGKLTGYIINAGTLADFEFVGAVIEGGTLAGKITNHSQSEGVIKNVSLAPNTVISGVNLQGNISGDNSAPALLEHVTIQPHSFLSGVKFGEAVVVEGQVICGEGVQAPAGICAADKPEPKYPDLNTTAINKQGKSISTQSACYGGIIVNSNPIETQATASLADDVTIQGQIQVDPAHVGQAADIVVYVSYQPLDEAATYFILNEAGQVVDYDNNPAHLVPFQVIPKLAESIEIVMYQGKLPVTGLLNIEFGYRLADGTVVHNFKPIEVNINK